MKGIFKKVFGKQGFLMVAAVALLAMVVPMSASAAPPAQDIDFGGGGFTFSLADIMTSAWSFIAEFNTYVILIMALILVSTLVGFVIWLFRKLPKFGGGSKA